MIYKNRPLVRKDNTIFYGSMADKYIAMIQIISTKELLGETVTNKTLVQIQSTDENVSAKDRVIKATEKNGLYESLDIASIWLDRSLKQ
ncbi:MAG: hypothetical protein R3Y12_00425 [Clostridia bacterium]